MFVCGFKNIFLIKKNLTRHIVLDICELWVMFEKIKSIWILFFYESKKKKKNLGRKVLWGSFFYKKYSKFCVVFFLTKIEVLKKFLLNIKNIFSV